ncbi:MAG TPA: hypothetical protein VEZ44_08995 [bacterium]|nr:hypothetical protein [bacterium]
MPIPRLSRQRLSGLILITVACLVLSSLPVQAQSGSIVPGRSIGVFHIGDPIETVTEVLGPASPPALLPQAMLSYYWPSRHLGVMVDVVTRKIVALAGSADVDYRTAKGVGIGSGADEVQSAFGRTPGIDNGDGTTVFVYDRVGVAFVVARAVSLRDRVSTIWVFSPGGYHQIFPKPLTAAAPHLSTALR